MDEEFNMSMRKFLKKVGVTSQQAIETAIHQSSPAEGQEYAAKIVLTIDGLDFEHVVTGTIISAK